MPTYQYACRACGHSFEVVRSMTDEPLRDCPRCGGELRKVYAPPAIAFRGSGFYTTDHGKKAKPSDSEGSSGASEPSGSGEDAGGSKTNPTVAKGKGSGRKESPATSSGSAGDRKDGSGGDGS